MGAASADSPASRYAVLQCADDPDFVKRGHGGYFRVYCSFLREEGEEWDLYRAFAGELPAGNGEAYDGLVLTGSCADAHSDDAWVLALVELVRRAVAGGKRVLGICFGHQVLCRALGGKIGRSAGGWDVGVTCIHPTPAAAKLFSALRLPQHIPVLEFHQDEVLELPPDTEVLASSNRTAVEVLRHGDNVLGIQGHPEYNKDIIGRFVDRLLDRSKIQASHAEGARASMAAMEPNREAWERLCREFLKGRALALY